MKFKVLKNLDSGMTSEVKLVEDIESGNKFACKVFKGGVSEEIQKAVKEEIKIMEMLEHDNIIGYVKAETDTQTFDISSPNGRRTKPEQSYFILMDYATHGDLFDIISSTGKFSEPLARYCFK